MKKLAKMALNKMGYEIQKQQPTRATTDLCERVCKQCGVEMLRPLPLDAYRRACQPLFAEPADVPMNFRMGHYKSVAEAVNNISMRNYFEIKDTGGQLAITDDYPASHYYSRQRMLYTAYAKCFGPRLDGLSALDVGCSSGFYSFFCSRLGAAAVTGIDARPEHADQFNLLHSMLGLGKSCAYRHLDMEFELEKLPGPFDIVLAQGVMYHVYDHPRFIRNLFRLTGKLLVLEGGCSGRSDNLCKAELEKTDSLRASIHGPVIYPSLPWMVELLRWAGFREINYVSLPEGIPDGWGFSSLHRAMLIALK